jgi:IS6 family transposase
LVPALPNRHYKHLDGERGNHPVRGLCCKSSVNEFDRLQHDQTAASAVQPALFKWRHFEPEIIVCAVRWHLRFSLSYRDVEKLLMERGLPADHTTIWRWVQRYAPELNKRCRRELRPTNGSWGVDEKYICQGGSWRYLYRAVDSTGATVDFWFSAERDAAAAKQFFQKALQAPGHPRPRVITVDGNPSYPKVIAELKQERKLDADVAVEPARL